MKNKTIAPIVLVLLLLSSATATPAPPQPTEQEKIAHVLNRLGFGARSGDVERVQKMGIREYIEQQLHPENISDTRAEDKVFHLASLRLSQEEIFKQYPQPQQVARGLGIDRADQAANRGKLQKYMADNMLQRPQELLQELIANRIVRGVESERQLQEVMTDFWFNHFNIYWDKGADRWLTTDFETRVIRPHAFGKFMDLLLATAESPAMLFYLDNHLSTAPAPVLQTALRARQAANGNAAPKRTPGINENYARELMELHTLGVDGGYTQKDVTEVARAFTGWTIDQPRQSGNFMFRPAMHDRGEKTVLGQRLPANRGIQDGQQVIDILARHPSTARFIATKLVRRFVSDDAPKSLIDKVAATYTKTDGDIREMLRTIFFSEEFMSADSFGKKMKSPLEYTVSAIRAFGGESAGGRQVAQAIGTMGQPLYQYQPPTGFPDRADYWMSDGALVARLNFAVTLASNRIPDTRVKLGNFKDAQAAALFIGSPDFQKR